MLHFTKLAQDHHIPLAFEGHHHCTRGWVQTHCPQCAGGRKGFHLGFSLSKGSFNCWRCGFLRQADVISMLLRLDRNQTFKLMRKYDDGRRAITRRKPVVRGRTIKPPNGTAPLARAHLRYLIGRGIGAEEIRLWELEGTRHLSGKWNWRVVFPIKNAESRTVAYLGRSIQPNDKRKYKMTENERCLEDPSTFVYGIHQVPGDRVIIVEGPTDVWSMGPGAVATLGVDWKPEQALKLKDFKHRFIMFDPGKQAQRQAAKLAKWLAFYPGNTELISGLSGDPGTLSKREIKDIRRELLDS